MSSKPQTKTTSLFRDNISDMTYFADHARAELLKKLAHLIDFTQLSLFVGGESGTGKTALLKQRFIKNRKPNWRVSIIDANFCRTSEQLIQQLQRDLELASAQQDDKTQLELVVGQLEGLKQSGLTPILVIDNSDHLAEPVLQFIAELVARSRSSLHAVFFGRELNSDINSALNSSDSIEETLVLMTLEPLSESDTTAYIQHILQQMQLNLPGPFSQKVVRQIYMQSGGLFSRINSRADKILKETLLGNNSQSSSTGNGLRLIALALLLSIIASFFFADDDQETNDEIDPEPEQTLQALDLPGKHKPLDSGSQPVQDRSPVVINPEHTETDKKTVEPASNLIKPVQSASEQPKPQTVVAMPSPVPSTSSAPPAPAKATENETTKPSIDNIKGKAWLAQQSPGAYTLQLVASGQENKIVSFIKRYQIEDQAAYFHSLRKGKDWYSLVYGIYESRAAAVRASKNLPGDLKSIQPWIRTLADIQKRL